MIRFRVITIRYRKSLLKAVAIILLVVCAVSLVQSLRVKKSLPVFGTSIYHENLASKFIQGSGKWEEEVLVKMLCWAMPCLSTQTANARASSWDIKEFIGRLPVVFTNVDVFSPKSYFSYHIPLMSLARAQSTITPGIELPVNPIPPIEENIWDNEALPEESDEVATETPVEKLQDFGEDPLVLIFHTHTSESFMPSEKYNYKPRDQFYHTEDLNFSVARVGRIMAEELEARNIPTLHDQTIHDIPTYTTSYSNSLKTVERLLKENPSIQIVIDVHRDAPVVDREKSREITTVRIDDVLYSRFMFVVGTDKTFPHPHWKENLKFAELLHERLEEKYPGISRGIDLRTERFNQHVSKKALLLEVGSHGNTLEEALASAKIFAEVLSEVIQELYSE